MPYIWLLGIRESPEITLKFDVLKFPLGRRVIIHWILKGVSKLNKPENHRSWVRKGGQERQPAAFKGSSEDDEYREENCWSSSGNRVEMQKLREEGILRRV